MKQSVLLLILKEELENTTKKTIIGKLQLKKIIKIPDWRAILFLRHIVIFFYALDSPSIYHW